MQPQYDLLDNTPDWRPSPEEQLIQMEDASEALYTLSDHTMPLKEFQQAYIEQRFEEQY